MATYSTRGSVAVIEVDNPPVNALRFVTLGLGHGDSGREGGGCVTEGVGGRGLGGGGGGDSVMPLYLKGNCVDLLHSPHPRAHFLSLIPTPGAHLLNHIF